MGCARFSTRRRQVFRKVGLNDQNYHVEADYLNRYMSVYKFEQISADLCVEMKKSNTVIEKWPTQLKLRVGQEGAEEEFRLNLGSSFTNTERYVEWRRVK